MDNNTFAWKRLLEGTLGVSDLSSQHEDENGTASQGGASSDPPNCGILIAIIGGAGLVFLICHFIYSYKTIALESMDSDDATVPVEEDMDLEAGDLDKRTQTSETSQETQ